MLFWIIFALTIWLIIVFLVLLASTMWRIDKEHRKAEEQAIEAMRKLKRGDLNLKKD